MTKREQIEEMAKEIFNSGIAINASDLAYGLIDNDDHFHRLAKYLYNAGYRKRPEDSVVLRIKELEDTCNKCHWVTDYKILKCHEEEVIKLCEQEVEQARKETAKEILNDIHRYNGGLFGTCFHKGHYVSDVRDLVKDIAEEYGVEVEE